MIITRTPFRISFFGGGTDYPGWYLKHGGAVLSTSIDKYCYITLRHLPPFFEHNLRLVYSVVEACRTIDEIQHPAVRETLRFLQCGKSLEIHHDGDLPARSGMGSSSSFTVGLLNALYALQGRMVSQRRLLTESIHIEQNLIGETVGSQDQAAAAYGGLNHILFKPDGHISVRPVIISPARKQQLSDHLMLFYTGIRRFASEVASTYVPTICDREKQLFRMADMVNEGLDILADGDLLDFGRLLHQAWEEKRALSKSISNSTVDGFYEKARQAGALGGKLTGAGGGGFLLLFVPPEKQPEVRKALHNLLHIPFSFDSDGSQIILYDPRICDYRELEADNNSGEIDCFRELNPHES
jgi:D-glycero-alpha-D-manno-heptose-7-phosphate kinase